MVIQRIIVSANTVSMGRHFCDVFSVIFKFLRDSHKIKESVTKFWIHIKRTERSHRCPTDTNDPFILVRPQARDFYAYGMISIHISGA